MKTFNKPTFGTPKPQRKWNKIKVPVLSFFLLLLSLSGAKAVALSGIYNIDATGSIPGSYKTFTLAVSDLKTLGVSGPVVFNATAATYSESITIPAITGASATNTITFRGKGRSSTILTSTAGTVSIFGASYINFDQMSIITTGTTGDLINAQATNYCSVTNCIVKGATTGSGILIYGYNSNSLTVFNNNMFGGQYGLYCYGTQASATYGNLMCTNNRFTNQILTAYYSFYGYNDNFSYNVVDSSTSSLTYDMINEYENGPTVTGNKFYATCGIGLDMIQENYYPVSGSPLTATITNNFFTGATTEQVFDNPQNLSSTTGNWIFAFNTIYNTTATSYGAIVEPQGCGSSTCVFASNIIYSTKGTPLNLNAMNSNAEFIQYDGNDIYFTTGSISFTYGTLTTSYTTYALYLTAVQGYGYDLNGTNFNPTFNSTVKPFDLHLSPSVQGPVGVWVSGISVDIDKNARLKYTAAGASESFYGDVNNDAGIIGLVGPKIVCPGASASIIVELANLGTNAITSCQVGWSWDGVPQTAVSTGSVPIPADAIVTLGSQTFAAGVTHKLKAWPIKPNGVQDGKATNDTLFATITPALTGTYTINPAGGSGSSNFTSFTSAVNYLNANGVCGPVVFNVNKGTYNEQVSLNNVQGSSSSNTITFDGGDSTKTIITYPGSATLPYTFRLNGANYVTLKRLNIVNTGATNGFTVHMTNGASYNTLTSCNINAVNTASATTVIGVGIMGPLYNTPGNNGNYNNIVNNNIDGAYANVVVYGNTATNVGLGNNVSKNKMTGAYLYGIYNSFQSGFTYTGNKIILRVTATGVSISITGTGSSSTTNYAATYGISCTSSDNHIISNNITSSSLTGVLDASADVGILGGKSMIYNNMCYGFFLSTSVGINVNIGYNTGVYHNTIFHAGTGGSAMTLTNTGATAAQGIDARDNILYKTNANAYCITVVTASFAANLDYNDYYASTGGNLANFGGTAYTSLATLVTANPSYNQHCFNTDPLLANIAPGYEDLHLAAKTFGLPGVYVGVSTDIDGDPRCVLFPNIGADETSYGKGKPVVKFFITSNIYPGSPSYVYQTGKVGEPKAFHWYLNGVHISDSVVLKTSAFVAGSNTLKLVTQSCGGNDSFQQTFNVAAPTSVPSTDFISNKNYITAGDNVSFLDQSTNGPTTWSWQVSPDSVVLSGVKIPSYKFLFGSAQYQNPQMQFVAAGKYNICLTASNGIGRGNRNCKIAYITVVNGVNLGSINTTSDAAGYLYDDGGPNANYLATKATPSILIAPCADSVYLTFSMFDLNCGYSFMQLYEGVDATGRRLDPCGGSGLSSGFNGGPTSGAVCAIACVPNITKPDTFKAKSSMFIQMNDGNVASGKGFAAYWWSKPLSHANKVKASFSVAARGDSICTNFQANFKNTSNATPKDLATFLWDLDGDLTTFECVGTCANAIWPYFTPGPVNITLIANSCGGSDTFAKTIMVYDPSKPKAAIYADNISPTVGSVVFLSAPIATCVEDYLWTITKSSFSGNGTGYASYVSGTTNVSANPHVTFSDTGYYDVKLYVDNLSGQQKDSIILKKYIHVRTPYCVPDVATLNQGIGITQVTLNTMSNSTQQAQHTYSDFTGNQALTTTLDQGVTYPVSISRNASLIYEPVNRTVFIDWDQDGVFSSTEVVGRDSNSFSTTWSSSITVPRKAKIGATTMRVAVNRGFYTNKPCGQNEFGEYQDYRIYIVAYNVPPVITLIGHQGFTDTLRLEQGNTFVDPGYSATSYLYGNMTKFVKRTSRRIGSSNPLDTFSNVLPASYLFSYNVTDSGGNKAITQYRIVQVTKDHTPPLLIVATPDTTIMEVTPTALSPFPAPLVISANDLVDGPLAGNVVNDASKVTSNILGMYVITYTVSDINGNVATVYRYVKIIDTVSPVMKLVGKDTITVEVNMPYTDAGVSTSDNYYLSPVLGPLVKSKTDLNLSKLGTYTTTFTLTDPSNNVAASVQRVIKVVDTMRPTIVMIGPGNDSMGVNTVYDDAGVTVTDNYDAKADISLVVAGTFYSKFSVGSKANVIGSYTIIYTATDKSGNSASATRTVLVKDVTPPVITLKGEESVAICRWFSYVDAGYDVSDDYDKTNVLKIDTLGNYYPNGNLIQGFYTIRFRATDNSGNSSISNKRTIWVKPADDNTCVSGIEQGLSLDKYINVYPNPNNGICTIDINLPSQERVRMSITNMLGQEIAVVQNGVIGQNKIALDLSNQKAGMYFLNIVGSGQTLVKRIELVK